MLFIIGNCPDCECVGHSTPSQSGEQSAIGQSGNRGTRQSGDTILISWGSAGVVAPSVGGRVCPDETYGEGAFRVRSENRHCPRGAPCRRGAARLQPSVARWPRRGTLSNRRLRSSDDSGDACPTRMRPPNTPSGHGIKYGVPRLPIACPRQVLSSGRYRDAGALSARHGNRPDVVWCRCAACGNARPRSPTANRFGPIWKATGSQLWRGARLRLGG